MSFSEREGHKKPSSNSLGSMDGRLKNAIWTAIHTHISKHYISWGITGYGDTKYKNAKARDLWTKFFEQNISRLPNAQDFLEEIDGRYKKLEWDEVYSLIEFFLKQDNVNYEEYNKILNEHNAAYRIINSLVQPITNTESIKAIESASNNTLSKEIKEHIQKAEYFYSNRQKPDFTNSCLESIKAVEGTCRLIFNNEEILGENVKKRIKFSENHNQHVAVILEKLNAFRNDVAAHATKQNGYIPTREDAILIHTICCGFVNYFKSINS